MKILTHRCAVLIRIQMKTAGFVYGRKDCLEVA